MKIPTFGEKFLVRFSSVARSVVRRRQNPRWINYAMAEDSEHRVPTSGFRERDQGFLLLVLLFLSLI